MKKNGDIKVTYSYEPISKEEEEWRLKKLFELLLEADMRSLEKLKMEGVGKSNSVLEA